MFQNRVIIISMIFTGICYGYNLKSEVEHESISVKKNRLFTITLPANRTTGADWFITQLPEQMLFISQQYVPDASSKGLMGRGGTSVFTFLPQDIGQAVLQLEYKQPWTTAPWKIKNYKVTILE